MLPGPPEQFFVTGVCVKCRRLKTFATTPRSAGIITKRARSPAERGMLLDMAQTWDELAAVRVAQIARRERSRGIAAALIPSIV